MKKLITLSIDGEIYEALQQKYPRQVSSLINELMRNLLFQNNKQENVLELGKELEEVDIELSLLKLKKDRIAAEKIKIEQDTERELKEIENQERLKKQTCSKCKQVKEEKEITHFGGICKNCYLAGENSELKKRYGGDKHE